MIRVNTLQSGTSTILSTTTSITASINAVTTAKSIIVASWRVNSTSPGTGCPLWYFSSTTQLTFECVSATVATGLIIDWTVIEFTSDSTISIEHGSVTAPAVNSTSTISAVTLANAFVIASWKNGGTVFYDDDTIFPDLTATTTITWRELVASPDVVRYQVINSSEISSQKLSALAQTGSPVDITCSAIIQNRSFIASYLIANAASTGLDFNNAFTSEFTSTTNARFTRGNGVQSADINAYIVQLPLDWITQWATVAVVSTSTTATLSYASVNTTRAFPWSGASPTNTQGRSNSANDSWANTAFTVDLNTSTSISLTREVAGPIAANFSSWVIENRPSWFLLQMNNELYNTMNTGLNN